MNRRPRHLFCLMGFAVISALGCTERPTEQIEAAERLVAEAKAGYPAIYASEDVRRLERVLNTLSATVEQQDRAAGLLRDYTHAAMISAGIVRDADQVIARARQRHAEAKAAAMAALEEAEEALGASRRLIAAVQTRHGLGRIRRQALDAEALTRSLTSVRGSMVEEDFLSAEARSRAITAQSGIVAGQVESIAVRMGDAATTRLAQY